MAEKPMRYQTPEERARASAKVSAAWTLASFIALSLNLAILGVFVYHWNSLGELNWNSVSLSLTVLEVLLIFGAFISFALFRGMISEQTSNGVEEVVDHRFQALKADLKNQFQALEKELEEWQLRHARHRADEILDILDTASNNAPPGGFDPSEGYTNG